jgi:hypothetical protein
MHRPTHTKMDEGPGWALFSGWGAGKTSSLRKGPGWGRLAWFWKGFRGPRV